MNTIAKIKSIVAKAASPEFKQSLKNEFVSARRVINARIIATRWERASHDRKKVLAWKGEYVVSCEHSISLLNRWYVTKELLENLNSSEKKELCLKEIKLLKDALDLEQWEEHNLVKSTIIVDENNCFLYGAKSYREALEQGRSTVEVHVTSVKPIHPNY